MKHASIPNVPTQLFLGGEWRDASDGGTFDVDNPATGEIIATVASATIEDGKAALDAAEQAFAGWAALKPRERAEVLRKAFELIIAQKEELARLVTMENGKALPDSRAEIAYAAEFFRWSAEEAVRAIGEFYRGPSTGARILVGHKPAGIAVLVTPWNYPAAMATRKIGPALAAGCTTVVKPASQTPYSGLAWGVLAEEAGLPAGVVNIVTGAAGAIGDEICENPLVKKITFTGSTEVGKILLAKAATTVKKVSMELGGNAPFLVFDDADIDRAVEGAMLAKYRNSGQTCVCTNRFFVQAGVYDRFVEKLAAASKKLKLGSGLEEGVQQGPLIDDKAVEKVEELIADATSKGGKVVTGGKRHELGGSFFQPTVISGATPDMKFMKEEIFGPVAPVFRFETEEEAVALANDTEFGLACYFYTGDLGRAFRVMEGLKYGMVGINEGLITTPEAPFGGVKESGLGREGGHQGIEDYLDTKYVCIGGLGL